MSNFIQTEFDFGEKQMDNNPITGENIHTDINNNPFEDLNDDSVDNEEICEEVDDSDCLDIESTDDTTSASKIKIEGDSWINEDLVPVTKIKCYVPRDLFNAIRSIESCVNRKFHSSNEFSIFIHGEMDEEGDFIVSSDYYIPKQKVGGASVDYLEEPEPYYNGCLHKHPSGCTTFSSVDKKYINSNFEFSLLYVNNKINMGIINIKYCGDRRLQMPLDIVMEDEEFNVVDITNITKETPKYSSPAMPINRSTTTPRILMPGFAENNNTAIQPTVFRGSNPKSLDDVVPTDIESDMDDYFTMLGYEV